MPITTRTSAAVIGIPLRDGYKPSNHSGLGYLLSRALTLSSPLPGVVVDANPASGSAIKIRDLLFFSLVLPLEDDDDTGADSSIGLRQYTGGLSVAIKREEIRPWVS